jgi:predicted phosphodiesterase
VIVHDHVHEAKIYRKSKKLEINMARFCGYLTEKLSIAVFDTNKRELKIINPK